MAIPVYLWLYSEEGKQLKGSVDVHRREGSIEITGLSHGVEIPTDDYSGKITATRQHSPFVFTKAQDVSSPYLYQIVSTGSVLKSAELKFYRINHAGQEEEYFNIFMENARITCIVPYMEDVKDPDFTHYDHMEAIEMTYEKITWIYLDGNIVHSDSWKERSAA